MSIKTLGILNVIYRDKESYESILILAKLRETTYVILFFWLMRYTILSKMT